MQKKANLWYAVFVLVFLTGSLKAQLYTNTPNIITGNNVGIGVPSPQTKLHIYGFSNTPTVRLEHNSTSSVTNAWDVYGDHTLFFKKYSYDASKGGSPTVLDIFSLTATGANVFGDLSISNDAYVTNQIGISTTSPSEALHINNGFAKASGYLVTGSSNNISDWNAPWYGLSLVQEADLDLDTDNSNSHPIVLQSYYGMAFRTSSGFMAMDNHGIVSIGLDGSEMNSLAQNTTASNPYKLYVAEGIRTEEVLIDVKDGNWWPDYVFEDDYDLRPLSEVETFIQKYKHLPDVPSAKTVEENGVQIGEMNATLLRKVEELTLYVIELEKKVKALEGK